MDPAPQHLGWAPVGPGTEGRGHACTGGLQGLAPINTAWSWLRFNLRTPALASHISSTAEEIISASAKIGYVCSLSRPAPPRRADQLQEGVDGLTTGFACRGVCGMLSIWGGTYGGMIPGIPNGFGLAVSSTRKESGTPVSRGHAPGHHSG